MSVLDEVAQERAAAEQIGGSVVLVHPVPWPIVPHVISKIGRTISEIGFRCRMAEFGARSVINRPCDIVGAQSIAIGEHVHIHGFGRLEALNAGSGVIRLKIGDGTFIQKFAHIGAIDSVKIGKGCLFASHIYITDHDHDFSNPMDPPISNGRVIASPVEIGDYVWLGQRAIVLKGVTIGRRSVIGAGSIVTRDIPEFSIAVGSPARVVRRWNQVSRQWERVESVA